MLNVYKNLWLPTIHYISTPTRAHDKSIYANYIYRPMYVKLFCAAGYCLN